MLFYLASWLMESFGPARLLQSYVVLIVLALYLGFFVTCYLLPKFYNWLPHDRGREFTLTAEAAKGKPTGSGSVFITFFTIICVLVVPLRGLQACILALTWLTMVTGFLDDRSTTSWGEYLKGALDLAICLVASFLLYFFISRSTPDGNMYIWLPFLSSSIKIAPWLYISMATILLWLSIFATYAGGGFMI